MEAIRALADIADPRRVADPGPTCSECAACIDELRAETVRAIGALRIPEGADLLLDLLTDASPGVRAEAFGALVRADPERFLFTLSGLDPDPHWTVRAAVATALAELPAEPAARRCSSAWRATQDHRVLPAVLAAMAKRNTPRRRRHRAQLLKAEDAVVRGAAAAAVAELKPAGAVEALQAAAVAAERDALYVARAGALLALVKVGAGGSSGSWSGVGRQRLGGPAARLAAARTARPGAPHGKGHPAGADAAGPRSVRDQTR